MSEPASGEFSTSVAHTGCEHFQDYRQEFGLHGFQLAHRTFSVSTTQAAREIKALECQCWQCGKNGPQLYGCLHCVFIGCAGEHLDAHFEQDGHFIALELTFGVLYCGQCQDHIYDSDAQALAEADLRAESALTRIESHRPWFAGRSLDMRLLDRHPERRNLHADQTIGLRGLMNLGSTCFMNCIVQALVHTPMLRDYFLSDLHDCRGKPDCLVCEVSRLVQEFYGGKTLPLALDRLLHLVWTHARQLAGYEQQDAHEFFICTLDVMHAHCRLSLPTGGGGGADDADPAGTATTPSTSATATPSPDAADHETSSTDNHSSGSSTAASPSVLDCGAEPDSSGAPVSPPATDAATGSCSCIIDRIFTGRLQSDVVCLACMSVSTTIDPFWDISLDLGEVHGISGPPRSLHECLERFTRAEHLGSGAKIRCSNCDAYQESTKRLSMHTLPVVASFHLKRFEHSSVANKKISTYIEFPHEIDMRPFMSVECDERLIREADDYAYTLYAVINHVGSMDAGHYTAFVRHCDDRWIRCDDHILTTVTLQRVLDSEGYMLFYHKKIVEYDCHAQTDRVW